LVGAVIDDGELPDREYEARIAALEAAGLGLWDSIATALREGSLDTAIREAEATPLRELVGTLPALRAVAFNGATSARIGRRQLVGSTLALIDLPSSSAAHAAMPFAEKRRRWLELQEFLH
jgi:hypoxanthine-DNA glycosylase